MQTLDWSFLDKGVLYDRTEEKKKLIAAFDRRISDQSTGEFILLSGKSGTGKTSLAKVLRKHVARKRGFFISGKFDQLQQSEPYSALVSAFTEFATIIINHQDQNYVEQIKQSILKSLQRDLHLLCEMIPALEQLVGPYQGSTNTPGAEATQRLRMATRNLVRAMCSQDKPLVLFLDDLQWADSSSLDLLHVLASDKACKGLVLIGACRYEEVALEDDLANFLRDLEDTTKTIVTPIEIHNLPIWAVNDLISDVLQMSQNGCKPLTKAIYKKTQGNILFTLKCLESLFDKRILVPGEDGQWEWNRNDLRAWGDGVNNVTDLVNHKIRQLRSQDQMVLTIAACFGIEIDEYILTEILPEMDVSGALDRSVESGLVLDQASGYFKFVHDRVQQASYDLILESNRAEFHLDLGQKLQKHLPQEDRDMHLFLILDQMFRGSSLLNDQNEKDKLAQLCLQAGEKATRSSDFERASDYISSGIDLLSVRRWRDQFYLSLDLYNAGAEAKYCTAKYEEMDGYINEILSNTRSLRDKIRVYSTMIFALSARHKFQEAIEVGFNVLEKLGEKFPAKSSVPRVLSEVAKVKWMLRNKTDNDILNLPDICEPDKIDAMSILNMISTSIFSGRRDMFAFVSLRMVQLTLQYGKCAVSAFGFQMFAATLRALGKFEECSRYANLGLKILDHYKIQEWTPRVFTAAYGINLYFMKPMHALVDPLRHAHQVGLETGDYEYATCASNMSSTLAFFLGKPFREVEEIVSPYVELMREYKQDQYLKLTLPVLQTVQNLGGHSKDPLSLTGDVMDQEEMIRVATANRDLSLTVTIAFYRLYLAYMFDKYELALEMAEESRSVAICLNFQHLFYEGLALAESARKQKRHRRAHIRAARKAVKKGKRLSQPCPTNTLNNIFLMEAEICFAKGDLDSAIPLYQRSIALADEAGYLHEKALANERLGIALGESDNQFRSTAFLKEALKLYGDWGAYAKVDQMKKKFPLLAADEATSTSSP